MSTGYEPLPLRFAQPGRYGVPEVPPQPNMGGFYRPDPLRPCGNSWLDQQLHRFRYKPQFHCAVAETDPWAAARGTYNLRIWFRTEDTYNPGRTLTITGIHMVPPYFLDRRDADEFAQWLLHTLCSLEEHEAREWFRRDGEIFDNPHKPR